MHLDNLLFILLIAMAALFRLLASQAGDTKKRSQKPDQRSTATPQPDQPIRRAPVESDEERIRKFLEALGQPATSRPPPPVVPRTNIPPRPLAPVHPPPIPTARNVLARTKRKVVEVPKTPALASIFEDHEAPPSLTPKDSIKSPADMTNLAGRTVAARAEVPVICCCSCGGTVGADRWPTAGKLAKKRKRKPGWKLT